MVIEHHLEDVGSFCKLHHERFTCLNYADEPPAPVNKFNLMINRCSAVHLVHSARHLKLQDLQFWRYGVNLAEFIGDGATKFKRQQASEFTSWWTKITGNQLVNSLRISVKYPETMKKKKQQLTFLIKHWLYSTFQPWKLISLENTNKKKERLDRLSRSSAFSLQSKIIWCWNTDRHTNVWATHTQPTNKFIYI